MPTGGKEIIMSNERITCTCDMCHEEITGEFHEFDETILCDDCFETHTLVCEECGERHWELNSNWVEDMSICDDCFEDTFVCDECGHRFLGRNNAGDSNFDLCEDCRDNYYVECEECGCLLREDRAWYNDGNPYCRSCYEEYVEVNKIHEYNYKPDALFRGYCDNNRYFGIELEIAGAGEDDEKAEELLELLNNGDNEINVYAKHDGSLCEGFEIVSHPMTLNYHMTMMNWQKFMEKAIHMGYRSHKTDCCGLHIHVSRDAFGDWSEEKHANIAKVVYFVEKHWAEMFQFSRRTEYTIQRWASRYGYEKTPIEVYEKARNVCDRYKNINLCNSKTIEFRFFRGTLKYNTFIATLQLVNEICNVAITLSQEEIDKLSWSEFVSRITQPELIQYLKERRLYVNEITESEEM